ncbi:MAG: hypothetical protein MJZ41_12445 [Bacteroidaceae bacterium]|nr:hypothetical protein [Bacteroidaceae bacterium]
MEENKERYENENINKDVEDVLNFADKVMEDPEQDVKKTAKLISPSFAKKFLVGGNPILSYALFAMNPFIYTSSILIRNHFADKKKKQQQKELLMRKVMAKQQEVIQRMQSQQEMNEQKIRNLQAVIDMLDETKEGLSKE